MVERRAAARTIASVKGALLGRKGQELPRPARMLRSISSESKLAEYTITVVDKLAQIGFHQLQRQLRIAVQVDDDHIFLNLRLPGPGRDTMPSGR